MHRLVHLRYRLQANARALAAHLLYEKRFGLDTHTQETLPWHGGEIVHYEPVTWRMLLRWLPRDSVGRDDVLLEVGSGKGRMVFMAARHYDFRRIVGIERSPELLAVARRNIERNRGRLRCRDVELVQADAREWPIPDDVTVVTLYNPFIGAVFADFLAQLLATVARRPRPIRVVYINAKEQDALEATGRFRLLASDGYEEVRSGDPKADADNLRFAGIRVYELSPAT